MNAPTSPPRARRAARTVVLLVAVAALATVVRARGLDLAQATAWVRGAGVVGVAALAGTYVAASVTLVPAAWLSAVVGFLFGPRGFLLAWPATVVGASLAFLLGRSALRRWVEARLRGSPRLAALDAAIGEGGARVVLLLRLTPLPHNLMNYGLSLTRVSFRDFVLGTAVGVIPISAVAVYAGTLATSAADVLAGRVQFGPWSWALSAAGAVAAVVAVALIARAARRALARSLAPTPPAGADGVGPGAGGPG